MGQGSGSGELRGGGQLPRRTSHRVRVCCTDKSIGTSLAPKKVFPNNTYYWRVRALDPNGISGVWNLGPDFNKAFNPSIPNLHLRDNHVTSRAATRHGVADRRLGSGPRRRELRRPGASMVARPRRDGCDPGHPTGGHQRDHRLDPAASGGGTPSSARPSSRSRTRSSLTGAKYCVSVRARAALGTTVDRVVSDWTYFRGPDLPGFTYTAHPVSGSNTAVTANDYLGPTQGSVTPRMPLFTWEHIAGACAYFVVVAKDENFTNVVDVARTRIPSYAPRGVYTDESTLYYWAVVPIVGGGSTRASTRCRTTLRGTSARTQSHRPLALPGPTRM